MLYIRRVVGRSMLPTLRPEQICIFIRLRRPRSQQIVLAEVAGRLVVKRLYIAIDGWELRGDNVAASTSYHVPAHAKDSRLIGRLVWPRRHQVRVD